jgi:hypothetical protein
MVHLFSLRKRSAHAIPDGLQAGRSICRFSNVFTMMPVSKNMKTARKAATASTTMLPKAQAFHRPSRHMNTSADKEACCRHPENMHMPEKNAGQT